MSIEGNPKFHCTCGNWSPKKNCLISRSKQQLVCGNCGLFEPLAKPAREYPTALSNTKIGSVVYASDGTIEYHSELEWGEIWAVEVEMAEKALCNFIILYNELIADLPDTNG